jgi:hypothetical protein
MAEQNQRVPHHHDTERYMLLTRRVTNLMAAVATERKKERTTGR